MHRVVLLSSGLLHVYVRTLSCRHVHRDVYVCTDQGPGIHNSCSSTYAAVMLNTSWPCHLGEYYRSDNHLLDDGRLDILLVERSALLPITTIIHLIPQIRTCLAFSLVPVPSRPVPSHASMHNAKEAVAFAPTTEHRTVGSV